MYNYKDKENMCVNNYGCFRASQILFKHLTYQELFQKTIYHQVDIAHKRHFIFRIQDVIGKRIIFTNQKNIKIKMRPIIYYQIQFKKN